MMLEQKTKWDEGTRKCVNGLGGLQIEKIPTVTKYISNKTLKFQNSSGRG